MDLVSMLLALCTVTLDPEQSRCASAGVCGVRDTEDNLLKVPHPVSLSDGSDSLLFVVLGCLLQVRTRLRVRISADSFT